MSKTAKSQIRASMNYQEKALERISAIYVTDEDLFEALQVIKQYHDGNRTQAIKQAIMVYAKQITG